eukprot:1316684-Prorocentrum_lima.AAC.1
MCPSSLKYVSDNIPVDANWASVCSTDWLGTVLQEAREPMPEPCNAGDDVSVAGAPSVDQTRPPSVPPNRRRQKGHPEKE